MPRRRPESARQQDARGSGAPATRSLAWWPLGGALLGAAFLADGLEWPAVPGLAAWAWALERAPRRPFLAGYLGGFGLHLVGSTWLHHTGTPLALAAVLYCSLYHGLFGVLAAAARRRAGLPVWLAAPLALYAAETLKEHLSLFGTTWFHLGHLTWRIATLAQLAEVGGVAALSFLLALVAAALVAAAGAVAGVGPAALGRRRTWVAPLAAASSLAVALGYGALRLAQVDLRDGPRLALVQGNVAQEVRNRIENADPIVARHMRLGLDLRGQELDLVVWPETTAQYFLEQEQALLRALGRMTAGLGAPLLLGAYGDNVGRSPSSSAFLIDTGGTIAGRADKRVLVPFAETLPVVRHIGPLRRRLGDFLQRTMHFRPDLTPGERPGVLGRGDHRYGVMICYADTLGWAGDELRRAGATALVAISNEAWFGRRELDQHLAMATFRAIETRLPMARATNTGLTAIIDPVGRVRERLERDREGVLVGVLPVTAARPVPWWIRRSVQYLVTSLVVAAWLLGWRRAGNGGADPGRGGP